MLIPTTIRKPRTQSSTRADPPSTISWQENQPLTFWRTPAARLSGQRAEGTNKFPPARTRTGGYGGI